MSLPIKLTVTEPSGEVVNTMFLDFHKKEDRVRIAKTAWWAMHNGKEMTTRPV